MDSVRVPHKSRDLSVIGCPGGKMPDDLWNIAVSCLKEAHFAVFPPKLIEMPVLAGCPKQVCNKCGMPRLQRREGGSSNAFNIRVRDVKTIFECKCNAGFTPGIVLDPFMGSGTTAIVAKGHGRDFIGLELNPRYIRIARKRLRDAKR